MQVNILYNYNANEQPCAQGLLLTHSAAVHIGKNSGYEVGQWNLSADFNNLYCMLTSPVVVEDA